MNKSILQLLSIIFFSLYLIQCKSKTENKTLSIENNQKEKVNEITVKHQTFEIDAKNDQVVEGNNGTILVIPKGCFKNAKGETVSENVKLELFEALNIDEMILAGLTTTSNGKQLETDGMLHIQATINGEKLSISKDNPIHIEIPSPKKKTGMMAYKGIADSTGSIDWVEPKKIENYLIPVDLKLLDFLPDSFQLAVEQEMPILGHTLATRDFTDSLYYSLSIIQKGEKSAYLPVPDYNEAYYNKNTKIVKGRYTNESYISDASLIDQIKSDTSISNLGINPASIKVIKSKKYQNTLISTREFESRLKVIFKTCDNPVLQIYIRNLNKNMYELDSMAALLLKGSEYEKEFMDFSGQRLTNVRNADKYSRLLRGYFDKQLKSVMNELERNNAQLKKALEKKDKEFEKVVADYRKVLWKREKYRMERYGFNWSDTGWVNIDRGVIPKDWFSKPLEITVTNGPQYDRVYTYVVFTSLQSLYRLNSGNKKVFYAGNEELKQMLMPKEKQGIAIAVGFIDEKLSVVVKEFVTGKEPKFELTLIESDKDKFNKLIEPYRKYRMENKIDTDLEYMKKFYEEQKRRKALLKVREFIAKLRSIAFPCEERVVVLQVEEEVLE